MSESQNCIGKLLNKDVTRDAIHIAVAPVIALETLKPGDNVGLLEGSKNGVGKDGLHIGIVDPYLKTDVNSGDKFYLFLYPNTISDLNHVWKHWAFDLETEAKRDAQIYLLGFINNFNWNDDHTDQQVLDHITKLFLNGEDIDFFNMFRNESDEKDWTPKFWDMLEIYADKKATTEQRKQYFGCCV